MNTPFIKICGVTRPEDASFALQNGADLIGMVFVEGAERQVSLELSKEIAAAVREEGGISVGVFAGLSIDCICQVCEEAKISYAQIYGLFSQQEMDRLQKVCKTIVAMGVSQDGRCLPAAYACDYLLFDHHSPGSGKTFAWDRFTPPHNFPWILAGGLHPRNVREAMHLLNPSGIDVSSGVERGKRGIKDQALIRALIEEVKRDA